MLAPAMRSDPAGELQALAGQLLRLRHMRQELLPVDASGPAWDLLLALFDADGEQGPFSVGDLAARANVARTTTVRWLRQLELHGLASVASDRQDKRLVRAAITEAGRQAMESVLAEAGLAVA